jgi:hypothetical protein
MRWPGLSNKTQGKVVRCACAAKTFYPLYASIRSAQPARPTKQHLKNNKKLTKNFL